MIASQHLYFFPVIRVLEGKFYKCDVTHSEGASSCRGKGGCAVTNSVCPSVALAICWD